MNIAGVRPRALLASLVSTMLIVTLLPASQAAAEPKSRHLAPQVDQPDSHGGEVAGGTAWAQRGQPRVVTPEPVWPSGTGQATLPPALTSASSAGMAAIAADVAATPVRAGSLPVWVRRAPGTAGERLTGVTVQALDRAKVPAGWRDSLLLRLAGDGEAVVSVDYGGFRYAYGAEWASRLRLWRVPECALTTPGRAGCGAVAVPSTNDVPGGKVTGQLPIAAAGGTLLAVAAGTAGSGGDFAATSLSPSSTWSVGGSAGDFSWSYGMRVPPAMGGPQPSLSLSYSSSSVDGRSAATNNQPSWVGEGFEYSPGYIERRYVPCAEDMEGDDHNNDRKTGDMCWRSDNAVMSLGGRSTELVFQQGKGWHARNEDGSKIEKLFGAPNSNEDNDGEYWRVTDTAGVQYFFGRHNLPGQTDVTNSTATVRVYGNNPNDKCYLAQFNLAHCNQAWRWNLDYVIDPRGNTMSLWYDKEFNKYAANATETEEVSYVRATALRRIDYGTWDRGADRSVTARAQVFFDPGDRCLSSCGTHDADHWPDVPWDLECTGEVCEGNFTPSFWTTKRLAKIRTRVWDTSKATPGWQDVDSWTLTHNFPSPGDGTHAGLWLAKVVHAGHVGGTVTMPPLTFEPVAMPNRVLTPTNTTNNWQRLASVVTESGGKIQVTYSLPECTANNLPAQNTNTKMCYPAIVVDPQDPQAERLVTEWWHKYRVEHISESDIQLVGAQPAPPKFTYYDYDNGTPAWHYADDDGLINKNRKTWSQYRGYATVKVRTGDVPGQQTLTVTRYLRGMHGDRATTSGGTRTVTVPASLGSETVHDEDAFAGMARETIVYNGVESKPVEKSVMVPWQSPATAERTINGDKVSARFVNTRVTYEATALGVDGVRGWRTTRTQSTFDDLYGTESSVQEDGNLAFSGDETCVSQTYNRNPDKNIVRLIKRSTATALPCGQNPAGEDDIISDMRLSYDGASSPDTMPAYGSVSKTEQLKSWTPSGGTVFQTVGQASYDVFGRAESSTDIRGNTTKLTYIPANAPVASTRSLTGSPYNWETITEIAPYWGAVKKTTDLNDRVSEAQFDAAGRVSKVWDAGWTEDDHPTQPMTEYTYNFAPGRDAYPYVTTRTLHAGGGYLTSYQIYDGLLRARQTQTAAVAGGGRVVADTVYDKLGRPATSYANHVEPGTASGALWHEPEWSVPAVAKTLYDNASRPRAEVFYGSDGVANLVEKWRTTTTYLGDQVTVTPPDGGIPTTTFSDVHGRMTELRQHTTAAGVDGAYDTTSYVYNRKGQLTKVTDPALNEWTYAYDIKGRQFQTNDPDRGRTTDTFTDYDDLATTTDARGEVIAYSYDQLGRKTGSYDDVVSAATKRSEWKYDRLYTGSTAAQGQLTEAIRYDPPGSANAYKWQVRQFTARYQPSGVNYVIPGNEAGISGTWVLGQSYSQFDGSPTEVEYPEGGGLAVETVTTAYDKVTGLPSTLNTNLPGTSSYVSLQQYTPFGEPTLTQRKIGGGVYVEDSTHYDEATRRVTKTSVLPETAAGTVSNRSYKYLPAGTITEVSDTPAVGLADTQCFGHDRLARLTSAWTPKAGVACATAPSVGNLGGPAPYWLDWTFDRTGNRLTEVSRTTTGDTKRDFAVPNGGTGVVRPHAVTSVTTTPPSGPAVTRGFGYDNTGNTISRTGPSGAAQTLAWDAEGRLSTVTESGTRVAGNTYDADGSRLVRRDATGTTLYLPGMEIRKPVGLGATATRYYSFGGRLIASRTPGAQALTWLYTDHQGTQQTTVNAYTQQGTTRRQTPYGEPRGSQPAWPNSKGFVGGDSEPTGLTHIGARQYDSALGRFISVDPLMDMTDPQQWNGFAYSNNSPVTFSDPTGMCLTANSISVQGDECGDREIPTVTPPPPSSSDEGNDDEPSGTTTTMPNGTVLYEEDGRTYINGFDVTKALRLKGAPSALDFARGIDRFVGENPDLDWMLYDDEGLGFLISHAWKYYGVKNGTHFHIWVKFAADPIMSDPRSWGDAMESGGLPGAGGLRGGRGPGGSPRKPPWTKRTDLGSCGAEDNSFVPGTHVLMGDGTMRPIEEVALGEAVMATDPVTGKTEARTVTATITGDGEKHLVAITVDTDGASGGATATLTATDEHPFWLPDRQEWVAAIDLRSGAWLQTSAGTWVQISAVTQWRQPFRVHNLTVDGIHTYYVLAGDTPVLVHNCTPLTKSEKRRLGALVPFADETAATMIRRRGGGQSQVNELETGYGEMTLRDLAHKAVRGDAEAVKAIKMVKQAGTQGKGGK